MFNFLDPKLMPKVTCAAPATDNYEASNLVSDKEAIRARGFLAYTVTKPPVELDFEFLCPVHISFVTLQTTVGRQKCTGIELFAKSGADPYVSIARAVYETAGLTFCNSRKYTKTSPPPFHDSSNGLFFFKSDQWRAFSNASFLKVLIFRTERSVPCLASIKVFGVASRTCSQTTVDTLSRIMGHTKKFGVSTTENKAGLEIPEDFTDDLTCEVMAVPMTLPSGKTIDRDTLEKHIENEKSFGRKPCDPFTGLKFSDTRKPVMNIALKSRIDMFLMQNSSNSVTYGLKRALGSDLSNPKKIKPGGDCECCVCQQKQFLYVIPCRHFYCRDCLVSLKILKCSCGREFAKNEAARYHNV